MNPLAIVGIGVGLVVLLWLAGRNRSEAGAGRSDPAIDSSEYLVQLPPPALFGRCLSVDDIEYAARLGSRNLMRLFLRERRRLAVAWLRQTRREAGRLFRLHVRMARHATDLRPLAEFRLLLHLGLFLTTYQLLAGLVRLYGPFRTRAFVGSVQTLAGVLAGLGGRIAQSIGPVSSPGLQVARVIR